MDLRDTASERAFRDELRQWLAAVLPDVGPPPPHDDWPARRAYDLRWQRTLFDGGYAGVDWPAEGGGRGASPFEQLIFKEECERAGAPYVGVGFVGLLHAGPTIIAEGTTVQKERYLPAILRGDDVWCQGFSEPDAGSDLASLRTRAVRDGDDYVVTGSKIWTSHAEVADFCELLVRTGDEDRPGNRGISWLIMPMDSTGIEIRPLRTIEGTTEFAQLFLNEVRVPVANRVGEENDGWRVTMVTLSFERGTAFVGELLEAMRLLGELDATARRFDLFAHDRSLQHRLGRLRRPVGPHQAQRLRGGPDRCARHRRIGVQALVLGARAEAGRPGHGDARPRRALCRPPRPARHPAGERRTGTQLVQVDQPDHRRGDLAGAAQHRRRAHPRPAPIAVTRAH